MKTFKQMFSTPVSLPCRGFWGPGGSLEFSGEALRITTESIEVSLAKPGGNAGPLIQPGDEVDLEVSLPVNYQGASAKCLRTHARVTRVKELSESSRWLHLVFRKASFKDRAEKPVRKQEKTIGWSM